MASANRSLACGFVRPVHQPGPHVAAVRNLDFLEVVFPIFQFVQLPLGGIRMQMRHALAGQRGRPRGQEQFQTFDHHFSRLRQAAGIEPQDAERQSGINRGLGLLRIDAQHREAGLPAAQQAASINGTKRSLQIRQT